MNYKRRFISCKRTEKSCKRTEALLVLLMVREDSLTAGKLCDFQNQSGDRFGR